MSGLRYLSVCSGIEAASVAWEPLGWSPVAFSEIEAFPSAVLAHRWPDVPNLGDMTEFERWPDATVDLLVGGTPCQDNSIGYSAGTGRAGSGLDGERSGLAFDFAGIAERFGARIVVWENVPNVLSRRNAGGFVRFVRRLVKGGYGVAWRVVDAAGIGPADQPRKRLYLVGHRDGPDRAAAILFEPEGARRDSPQDAPSAPLLTRRGAMAFDDRTPCILDEGGPRIATPVEWERAMGFPAGHTAVPWRGKPADRCPDGPRYNALGNSMPVDVMRWIGQRIDFVDAIAGEVAA